MFHINHNPRTNYDFGIRHQSQGRVPVRRPLRAQACCASALRECDVSSRKRRVPGGSGTDGRAVTGPAAGPRGPAALQSGCRAPARPLGPANSYDRRAPVFYWSAPGRR